MSGQRKRVKPCLGRIVESHLGRACGLRPRLREDPYGLRSRRLAYHTGKTIATAFAGSQKQRFQTKRLGLLPQKYQSKQERHLPLIGNDAREVSS